jgi:hypothetical protein
MNTNKAGGKRKGSGRKTKNVKDTTVSILISQKEEIKNRGLKLSPLIRILLKNYLKSNTMASFYDNFSKGDLVELNNQRALILDVQDVQELKEYSFGIVGEAEVKQVIFHPDGTSFETSKHVSIYLLF